MTKLKTIYQFTTKPTKAAKSRTMVSFYDPTLNLHHDQAFVVPNMASFIRDVTEHGNIGALKKRLLSLSPIAIIKLAWWNKLNLLALAKKDFSYAVLMLIQIELLKIGQYRPSLIIISDQITDLSVATDNPVILKLAQTQIKALGLKYAIITNNLQPTLLFLATHKINPDYVFSAFNTNGYEMNPSKTASEVTIGMIDPSKLIALATSLDPKEEKYITSQGIDKVIINWFS